MYDAKSGSSFYKLIFNKNLKKWKIFSTIFSGTKNIASKRLKNVLFFSFSWKVRNELASAFPEQTRYYILYIVFGDKGGLICTNLQHKYKMFILCLVNFMIRFKTCVSDPWPRLNSKKISSTNTESIFSLLKLCVSDNDFDIFKLRISLKHCEYLFPLGSHCLTSIWLRRRPHR